MNIEELKKLQDEIHQTAIDHGWWNKNRELPELLVLLHSEISEAFEAEQSNIMAVYYKDNKPEGYLVEMADYVIRIMDLFGHYQINIETYMETLDYKNLFSKFLECLLEINQFDIYKKEIFLNHICCLHFNVSKSLEIYRAEKNNLVMIGKISEILTRSIIGCFAYAKYLDHDLMEIIKEKHEYNKTRPYRHGGKKA